VDRTLKKKRDAGDLKSMFKRLSFLSKQNENVEPAFAFKSEINVT